MSMYLTSEEIKELVALLNEKRSNFDKMLNENKEFEEVKRLFNEIRQLEKTLKQNHQNATSGL
jgi:hypothetical protein